MATGLFHVAASPGGERGADLHLHKKGLPQVSLEETLEPSQEDGPRKDISTRDLMLSGSIDRVTLEGALSPTFPGYRFRPHVEGYEHDEIADMLECFVGNGKFGKLHKARVKLRDLLRTGPSKSARREALL